MARIVDDDGDNLDLHDAEAVQRMLQQAASEVTGSGHDMPPHYNQQASGLQGGAQALPPPQAAATLEPLGLTEITMRIHGALRSASTRIPPPWHVQLVGGRFPGAVAELHLQPRLVTDRLHGATNTATINFPPGRFAFSERLQQKVIADLMTARERGRVAGPIFTLSWVTLGDSLVQVQAEFVEVNDATAVVAQLQSARYDAAFGPLTNLKSNPVSTVIQVTDFGRILSGNGEPISAAQLGQVFSTASGDSHVVDSFDDNVKYVAFLKATTVFALLGSPFHSGELQTLLWQVGVFFHAVHVKPEAYTRMQRNNTNATPAAGYPFTNMMSAAPMMGPGVGHRGAPFGYPGESAPWVAAGDDATDELSLALHDATAAVDGPDLFDLIGADLAGPAAPPSRVARHRDVTIKGDDDAQVAPEVAALLTEAVEPPAFVLPTYNAAATAGQWIAFDPANNGMSYGGAQQWSAPILHHGGRANYATGVLQHFDGSPVLPLHPAAMTGGVLDRPPTPTAELALPEEEDLAAAITSEASKADSVAEAFKSFVAASGSSSLTPAGKRRVAEALGQSLPKLVADSEAVGERLVEFQLLDEERVLRVLQQTVPDLAVRERLPAFLLQLATGWPIGLFRILLVSLSPARVLSMLHTPHFSRNLIALMKRAFDVKSDAEQAKRDDVRNQLTLALLGPAHVQIFSTISGCRFVEACCAVSGGAVNKVEIARAVMRRLAQPVFAMRTQPLTSAIASQLHGLCCIATATMGGDAAQDADVVMSVAYLWFRNECRKCLSISTTRVHPDASEMIAARLRSDDYMSSVPAELAMSHADRVLLARDFATRGGQIVVPPTVITLPSWLPQLIATYPRRAAPFPAVAGSCTVSVSASNGLYFFQEGRNEPSYRHPISNSEYVPAPQAYVWDRLLSHRDVADLVHKYTGAPASAQRMNRDVIDSWLDDQRHRNDIIDGAVVLGLGIRYAAEAPSLAPVDGKANAAAPSSKKHRTEATAAAEPSKDPAAAIVAPAVAAAPAAIVVIPAAIAAYPSAGEPFPALPDGGWVAKTSASNGYYYFALGETSTYKHPTDGKMYPVAPQAFVERAGVTPDRLAADFRLDIRRVRQWMADQTIRDPRIDAAALTAFHVTYKERSREEGGKKEKPDKGAAATSGHRSKKEKRGADADTAAAVVDAQAHAPNGDTPAAPSAP